jgi:putative ABC transport system permease protein
MAIGIGFIVFLLSLGYGLERLVINEVTKIEDLKQIDVMPTVSSNVLLDSENVERISNIESVEDVMPLVNIASRVEYQQSNTDVVVYGVQPKYIEQSPITFSAGSVFGEENKGVVVNDEFLMTIGVLAKDAIDKEIDMEFVLSDVVNESVNEERDGEELGDKYLYKIVGVVDDSNPPVIYVPILDLESFGIEEFSQLRVTIQSENNIPEVRKQIEVLGFETTSVMDTISQVESLFSYTKIGLLFIGVIALSIAILGMFNTLTVSLLERTREVGLMKTIGMKSDEIRSLFINESMLMGITGGLLGVTFGVLLGLILSCVISIISISKGGAYITLSFLPIGLILGIIVISTFVGFLTGLYPSNRAVKMAPLDALRYE